MEVRINETIDLLRKVILDKNCDRMNKSTVKGFLGELIVRRQLEEAGFDVKHHGNQTGYDLSIGQDGRFKIDVKASLLKDEYSWGCDHWGWALVHSNKKKQISATHFICVGCGSGLEARLFIIVPAFMAERFPAGIRQFNRVNHALCAFPGTDRPVRKLSLKESNYIAVCERLLRDESIKTLHPEESFRSIFS